MKHLILYIGPRRDQELGGIMNVLKVFQNLETLVLTYSSRIHSKLDIMASFEMYWEEKLRGNGPIFIVVELLEALGASKRTMFLS